MVRTANLKCNCRNVIGVLVGIGYQVCKDIMRQANLVTVFYCKSSCQSELANTPGYWMAIGRVHFERWPAPQSYFAMNPYKKARFDDPSEIRKSTRCYLRQLGGHDLPRFPGGSFCTISSRKLLELEQRHHICSLQWAVFIAPNIWILGGIDNIAFYGKYHTVHFCMGGVRQISLDQVMIDKIDMTSMKTRCDQMITFGVQYKLPFLTWVCQGLCRGEICLIAAFLGNQERNLYIKTSKMDLTLVKPLPFMVHLNYDLTPFVSLPEPPKVPQVPNETPIAEMERLLPMSIDSIKETCLNKNINDHFLCYLFRDKSFDRDFRWYVLKMLVEKDGDSLVYGRLPYHMQLVDKVIGC